jgi:DNA-binding NarL/FixJ family response regulator
MVERAVGRTHDMAVVGRAAAIEDLVALARATEPDVVIVGLHGAALPLACIELLLERPRMKLLGIEEQDGHAQLYELRPEQVELGEVSPDEVIETIRAAVQRPIPF